MALAFHELATNAAKYGALSRSSGRVRVSWTVIPGGVRPQLLMEWTESSGPTVAKPARRGFGTRMVQGAVTGELGGSAELDFEPAGFHARLSIPLDFDQDGQPDEPTLKRGVHEGFGAAGLSSWRWNA
jgi:two-component sensor histidine kinase